MSSRSSLRRSRRAPKKNNSEYNVGDLVEVNRNGETHRARLAQLLTEGSSVHPRWLVKFEGTHKDEEYYEHLFGKILESSVDQEGSGGEMAAPPPKKTKGVVVRAKPDDSGDSMLESTGHDVMEEQETKKTVPFSNESSPAGSGEDSSSAVDADGKVSAREERSRRRQAIIDEFGVPLTGSGSSLSNGKRKLPGTVNGSKNAKGNKKARADGDEKCLKVKLLTGTLYLYRGRQRRAEFVRRV